MNKTIIALFMLLSATSVFATEQVTSAEAAIAREARTLDPALLKKRYDFCIKNIQRESSNPKCVSCHKSGNFYPGDIPRQPIEIEQAAQTFLDRIGDKTHAPLLKNNNNLPIVIVLMGDMRTDVLKSHYLEAMKIVQGQNGNSQCLGCHTSGFTIPTIPKTLETIKPAAQSFMKIMSDSKHAELVKGDEKLQSAVKLMGDVK